MSGVIFKHPNKQIGDLYLRLAPTKVEWTYNLNTNVVDTYGGQVVQLLSINYNKLVLEGQFGIEGPHGRAIVGSGTKKKLVERPVAEYFDLNKGRGGPAVGQQQYKIGLTQMTQYFRTYFSLASQGFDRTKSGNLLRGQFDQEPMSIYYDSDLADDGMRSWTGYPVTFPSYSRANDEFTPTWRVEFEVEEPDQTVAHKGLPAALRRLRAAVGYKAFSPFSDPLGASLYDTKNGKLKRNKKTLLFAKTAAEKQSQLVFDELGNLLPSMNEADLNELIQFGASRPHIFAKKQVEKTSVKKKATKTKTGGQPNASWTQAQVNKWAETHANQITSDTKGVLTVVDSNGKVIWKRK